MYSENCLKNSKKNSLFTRRPFGHSKGIWALEGSLGTQNTRAIEHVRHPKHLNTQALERLETLYLADSIRGVFRVLSNI